MLIKYIEIIIFEGDLFPKLLILLYILLFLLLCGLTYFDEKENQNKYYKNNIYSQWRMFKN